MWTIKGSEIMNIVYPKTTIQDVESLQNEVLEHLKNSHLVQTYNEHSILLDKYLNLNLWLSWIFAICFGFCVCCPLLLPAVIPLIQFLIIEGILIVGTIILFVYHHRIDNKEDVEANNRHNVANKVYKLCDDIGILQGGVDSLQARTDCDLLSNLRNVDLIKDFLKNNETIQLVNQDRYTFQVQFLINGYPYKTASFVTNGSEEDFKKITTYDFTFIDDLYEETKARVYSYLTNPDYA